MENQQTSAELLKICAEIIETNVNYYNIAIENCNLNMAEFETVKNKFGDRIDDKNIFLPEGKEELVDELERLKKNLAKWQNMQPEDLAANLSTSKEKMANAEGCKVDLLSLTISDDELANLPKEDKKQIEDVREGLEENLFYDAIWELGIDEEAAKSSKNHLKILEKTKELRVQLVADLEEAIEHKKEIDAKSMEEFAGDSLDSAKQTLAYEIGLRRKHSLADAMGVQAFVGLYRKNNSDAEPEMRLEDETITKIAELSEEEFRAMQTDLGRKKDRYEKMAQRRVATVQRGSKLMNAQPKFAKVAIGASLASVAALLGGALLYDNTAGSTASAVILNAGGLGSYGGLAVMGADVAAVAIDGVVESATKKAGVSAKKAVENYLKGMPIREEVAVSENGELGSEE